MRVMPTYIELLHWLITTAYRYLILRPIQILFSYLEIQPYLFLCFFIGRIFYSKYTVDKQLIIFSHLQFFILNIFTVYMSEKKKFKNNCILDILVKK